jgi:hypothetical protein
MATKIRLRLLSISVAVAVALGITPAGTANAHPHQEERACPKFEKLFQEYGLLPVKTFSYIAWRESRCNPLAINAKWDKHGNMVYHLNKNKTWDSGLLQINSTWKSVTKRICKAGLPELIKLDCNLKVAKYLLDNGGLNHWRATAP